MRMPQQETRDINLVVDMSLQPSMEDGIGREFWICLVPTQEAI
jgi:hypothetical protein